MPMNPIAIILTGPASLLGAVLVLGQFKVIMVGLANLAAARGANPMLKFVRPYLKTIVASLEGTFGLAYKFQPSSTQVVLMALILVVAISTERILAQLQARPSSSSSSRRAS